MDEGIVERCENTGNAEYQFCSLSATLPLTYMLEFEDREMAGTVAQSVRLALKENKFVLTSISNLRAEGDVLLGGTDDFLWRHGGFC